MLQKEGQSLGNEKWLVCSVNGWWLNIALKTDFFFDMVNSQLCQTIESCPKVLSLTFGKNISYDKNGLKLRVSN